MIAVLISIFAYFYGINRTEWAVLILTIGAVISAELINTALEQAVNTATEKILPSAKLAKDALALSDPHCPHGRPVWTTLTRGELFARVRRTETIVF